MRLSAQCALRVELPHAYPEVAPRLAVEELAPPAAAALEDHLRCEAARLVGESSVFVLVDAGRAWLEGHPGEEAEEPAAPVPEPPEEAGDPSPWWLEYEQGEPIAAAEHAEWLRAAAAAADAAAARPWRSGRRGATEFTIGLVGKPSAGKSTLFCAITGAQAKVAAHPFTTIDPNHAVTMVRVPVPAALQDGGGDRVAAAPVTVKDVAGLVPGACQGRGKGNQFLNDLLDADTLIHVLDGSGRSDRDGVLVAEGGVTSPEEDAVWVEEEIRLWVFGNVRAA